MQRPLYAALLALVISLVVGRFMVPWLHALKFGQEVRNDGPKTHLVKQGTPTMGGLIFGLAALLAVIALAGEWGSFLAMGLVLSYGFGLLGFLDDFLKIKLKRSLGLRAWQKLVGQFGLAVIVALWAYNDPCIGSEILVPWLNVTVDLGAMYVPFMTLVIVAVVNAVNLTDGLDGLASGIMLLDSLTFVIILAVLAAAAELAGDVLLNMQLGGMTVYAGAVAGALMGFLRYNTYPAKVFMGDTGSMGLGGALCGMAIASKCALVLPVVGVMFVASAVSVILQVGSFKLRHKRVFLMAPLHHHYEQKGCAETTIVAMYMLITLACCMLALIGFLK